MKQLILAIESSCDETAAALLGDGKLLSEQVASQAIHAHYGGVVPELASRAHQQYTPKVVDRVLKKAQVAPSALTHIAFTQGPGLMGSLLVGISFAKGMALSLGIPLVPIHHIKAHLFANFLGKKIPKFPFLGLVVSGGHTQLIWVKSYHEMTLLGQTRDDAAGEAFDKIAKCLGFPYPGGAHIDHWAQKGDPKAFDFPITCLEGLDFSFSGIKTAVRYFLDKKTAEDSAFIEKKRADLCASVQHTIVAMLMKKVTEALHRTSAERLVIGGGVAANSLLQQALLDLKTQKGIQLFIPTLAHCQDNAAMIAIAAHYILQEQPASWDFSLPSMPRMPLEELKKREVASLLRPSFRNHFLS